MPSVLKPARRVIFSAPLRRLALIPCALLLAACSRSPDSKSPTPPAAGAVATAWPMTRGSPALGGSVSAKLPTAPAIAWTFTAAGPISGEATISLGPDRVYVGTAPGVLHCLDAATGQEVWKFTAKDGIVAAPAFAGGRLFVSSNDNSLYALDAAKGAELWKFTAEDKISSGATIVRAPGGDGDWVLLNGYDGTTRVLQAADGKLVWTYKTDNYINGAPAVVDGRYLVFGGCDALLHVVNLADGKLVHTIEAGAYIPASIATLGPQAFCGNYANETVGFDVVAGKVLWTYKDRALPFFSSPAVNEKLVLIGSRDKHLHAIDRQTGEGVWKFATGGRVESSPIVFSDGVVFGSSDGRLYAANLADGSELWRLELGEPLTASPAFGAGQIVIGGEKGTVFALKAGPPASPKKT